MPRPARRAGGVRSVSLRIERRLVVDAKAHANYIGQATIRRIVELAAKGRGYEGTFVPLRARTVERYEDAGAPHAGARSFLRRTGRLLGGLRFIVTMLAGDRPLVRILGPRGDEQKIQYLSQRRPFLGLSSADLKQIARSAPRKVPMRTQRGPTKR